MDNTLTGTITQIGADQQISDTFKKRLLLVKTDELYPQEVAFEFLQAKTSDLDVLQVGEVVTVHFNIRGSEWKGKHFVSLNGWKVVQNSGTQLPEPIIAGFPPPTGEGGDLPF